MPVSQRRSQCSDKWIIFIGAPIISDDSWPRVSVLRVGRSETRQYLMADSARRKGETRRGRVATKAAFSKEIIRFLPRAAREIFDPCKALDESSLSIVSRVLSRSISALIILITVSVIKPASLISAHFARGFDVDSVFRRACGYPRAWQQFEFERYSGGYRRLLRVQHQVQSLGLQGFLAP